MRLMDDREHVRLYLATLAEFGKLPVDVFDEFEDLYNELHAWREFGELAGVDRSDPELLVAHLEADRAELGELRARLAGKGDR